MNTSFTGIVLQTVATHPYLNSTLSNEIVAHDFDSAIRIAAKKKPCKTVLSSSYYNKRLFRYVTIQIATTIASPVGTLFHFSALIFRVIAVTAALFVSGNIHRQYQLAALHFKAMVLDAIGTLAVISSYFIYIHPLAFIGSIYPTDTAMSFSEENVSAHTYIIEYFKSRYNIRIRSFDFNTVFKAAEKKERALVNTLALRHYLNILHTLNPILVPKHIKLRKTTTIDSAIAVHLLLLQATNKIDQITFEPHTILPIEELERYSDAMETNASCCTHILTSILKKKCEERRNLPAFQEIVKQSISQNIRSLEQFKWKKEILDDARMRRNLRTPFTIGALSTTVIAVAIF